MVARKQKDRTVPVTMRALLQRINRALALDAEVLKTARGQRAEMELGQFYTIDQRRNVIVDKDVDPEALARKLGALKEYEHVVDK